MQMIKEEGGQVKINIVPMLGQPKGFEIERGVMNYDVNDENILNAYKESVSGLTLVRKPPLVDGNGAKLN